MKNKFTFKNQIDVLIILFGKLVFPEEMSDNLCYISLLNKKLQKTNNKSQLTVSNDYYPTKVKGGNND